MLPLHHCVQLPAPIIVGTGRFTLQHLLPFYLQYPSEHPLAIALIDRSIVFQLVPCGLY